MFPSWITRIFGKSTKSSRRQRRAASPSNRRTCSPRLEALEDRLLLSADNWIAGSGNWNVGSHWSLGHAPGTSDTAIINTSSAATITIQSGDHIQVQSITTGSNDKLSIAGGTLTVTSGTSILNSALSMSGGALTVTKAGVSLTAKGSTSISGGGLYAENGATLSLPNLTSYTAAAGGYNTLQADGAHSLLNVSALSKLMLDSSMGINAYNGAEVELIGMTSLNRSSYGTIYINDTGSSKLLDSNVATFNGILVSLDGTDTQVANSWTTFTNGSLSIADGSYTLSKLTNVNGSGLYVSNGGSLALPYLTSYTSTAGGYNTFQADGVHSVLNVSELSKLTLDSSMGINAYNGGEIELTGMSTLYRNGYGTIYINDTGNSKLLDSNVTTLNGIVVTLDGTDTRVANSWTTFTNGSLSVTGGSYNLSKLTNVNGSGLYVSNGGSLALPYLTSYTSTSGGYNTFQADGATGDGTPSVLNLSLLNKLTLASSLGINAYNGAEIELTGMTSLARSSYGTIYVNDTGGSKLLDSNVATLNGIVVTQDGTDTQVADSWTAFTNGSLSITGGSYTLSKLTDVNGSGLYVSNGGSLALPYLTSYTSTAGGYNTFQADGATGDGTPSILNLPALSKLTLGSSLGINAYNGAEIELTGMTSLARSSYGTIYINDTGGSELIDRKVSSLNGIVVTLDGTDTQVENSWTAFTNGSLSITGGSYNLSKLTNVNGSGLYLSNGGSLALPYLTSYTSDVGGYNTFQADGTAGDGTPSVLNLSALSKLTLNSSLGINAYNGGEIELTGVSSLNRSTNGTIYINDTGGSELIDSKVASLNGIVVTLDGTDTQVANSWTAFTNGSLSVTGGSYSLSKLTNVNGSGLYVSNGGNLALPYLTSYTANVGGYNTFQADGTGGDGTPSALNLSALSELTLNSSLGINVYNGAEIELTGMTSLNRSNYGTIYINDTGSSELLDSKVSSLNGVVATLDGTDTQVANAWTSFTNGSLTVTGGALNFSKMANFASSNLSLRGGAALSIAGNYSNSGSLDVDAGSTLTIGGSYTQTSAGSLDVQIDAMPSNEQFGQIVVKGAANLNGNFNVDLVDGYAPPSGAVYSVMTFASETGAFENISGLGTYFTEQLKATSLDLVANG